MFAPNLNQLTLDSSDIVNGQKSSTDCQEHAVRRKRSVRRKGATTLEMAIVLPVFLLFVFGIVQYGHLMWVSNMLRNAVREAARYGSTEGITTDEVIEDVRNQMRGIVDVNLLKIEVKDASAFDTADETPVTKEDLKDLAKIELFTLPPRHLFVVQASINVDDVVLVRTPVVGGFDLFGQTFMRHE